MGLDFDPDRCRGGRKLYRLVGLPRQGPETPTSWRSSPIGPRHGPPPEADLSRLQRLGWQGLGWVDEFLNIFLCKVLQNPSRIIQAVEQ